MASRLNKRLDLANKDRKSNDRALRQLVKFAEVINLYQQSITITVVLKLKMVKLLCILMA